MKKRGIYRRKRPPGGGSPKRGDEKGTADIIQQAQAWPRPGKKELGSVAHPHGTTGTHQRTPEDP